MWGGRFAEGPSAIMREINASIPFDKALWRQDIAASKAHADMLANYLTENLEAENVAPMIPREKLQELRDSKPVEYPSMSITAIGLSDEDTTIREINLGLRADSRSRTSPGIRMPRFNGCRCGRSP